MKIANDTVVKIKYTIQVRDGVTPEELDQVFETQFLYGRDPVIPALERALLNREQGERFTIEIPPKQAFGNYDPSLVNEVPLSRISRPEALKKQEYYQELDVNGNKVRFFVQEINEDHVVADFNHPAAGKSLILDVDVIEVRAATAQEILKCMSCSTGGG